MVTLRTSLIFVFLTPRKTVQGQGGLDYAGSPGSYLGRQRKPQNDQALDNHNDQNRLCSMQRVCLLTLSLGQ